MSISNIFEKSVNVEKYFDSKTITTFGGVGEATATSGTTTTFKFDYEDVARKNRKTGEKQRQIEHGKIMTKVHGAATRGGTMKIAQRRVTFTNFMQIKTRTQEEEVVELHLTKPDLK